MSSESKVRESLRPNITSFQSKSHLLWVSRGLRRGRDAYPMDSRFKIPAPLVIRTAGTREREAEPGMKKLVQGSSRRVGKSACMRRRRDAERNEVEAGGLPVEKSRYRVARGPYRKPTQVDEERIT